MASYAERGDDLYETPPEAVHALLKHEIIPLTVWEPACGPGSIVTVLRESGRAVIASDLVDYGGRDCKGGIDFLMERSAPNGVPCIITNPPFKLASLFIEHATDLVPHVCMLLRFEYFAAQHGGLLDRKLPSRIYAFTKRLPRMHRHGWDGPRAVARTNFAWYVWDRDDPPIVMQTRLYRITWGNT